MVWIFSGIAHFVFFALWHWAMDAQSVHSQVSVLNFPETCIVHCKTLKVTWSGICVVREKSKEIQKNVNHMSKSMKCTGADPGFFFTRGCTCLLLYFNTNKPQCFFLQNTSCIERGGVHPLHPPPRSAPGASTITLWVVSHKMITWQKHFPRFVHIKMESVQSFFLGWLNNPTK